LSSSFTGWRLNAIDFELMMFILGVCFEVKEVIVMEIEINQLKDSIDRMPAGVHTHGRQKREATPICEKSPEFAEHYRFEDEDAPCNDGRS